MVDRRSTAAIPIFRPHPDRPMSIVFFASGGPGNIETAFGAEDESAGALRIDLVVTDRDRIPSIDVARSRGRPHLVFDFAAGCGPVPGPSATEQTRRAYGAARERLHTAILRELQAIERTRGYPFDVAVLAYRRIVTGPLLAYFAGRMINQHPADLADVADGQRLFIGIAGHARALRSGRGRSRTSTIIVRDGIDTGEILARGPWVPFAGRADDLSAIAEHENVQKHESDRPVLRFVLRALAAGEFALSGEHRHVDGCAVVCYRGEPLGYGGIELAADDASRGVARRASAGPAWRTR